jgi:hypothetical protein
MNVAVEMDIPLEVRYLICDTNIDQRHIFAGDYKQTFGNIRNTNYSCLQTNLSSFCSNQCLFPAVCTSSTGKCECPSPTQPSDSIEATKRTCRCPGHPLIYYDGSNCTDATGKNASAIFIHLQSLNTSSSGSNSTGNVVPLTHETSEFVSKRSVYQEQYSTTRESSKLSFIHRLYSALIRSHLQISNILNALNTTCNGSCIRIRDTE